MGNKCNENFAVIIIDLIRSRSYATEQRQAIQNLLAAMIEMCNDLFNDNLVKRMMFCGGDEVQAIFNDATSALEAYRLIALALGNYRIRGGLGIGKWTIRIDSLDSTAQDGEVFHNAREAINRARISDSLLCISGFSNKHFDKCIDEWSKLLVDDIIHNDQEAFYAELFSQINMARSSVEPPFDSSRIIPLIDGGSSIAQFGNLEVVFSCRRILKLDEPRFELSQASRNIDLFKEKYPFIYQAKQDEQQFASTSMHDLFKDEVVEHES